MKHPVFEALLDRLSDDMAKTKGTGMKRSVAQKVQKCSKCGGDATKFKDALSRKEYTLTAWCQSCQDDFFGNDCTKEIAQLDD